MKALCPYCKTELNGDLALPRMSTRQSVIYNAVANASNGGIRTTRLVELIYDSTSPGPGGGIVLRVQIHELNKKLSAINQRIKGSGGSYWLIDLSGVVR